MSIRTFVLAAAAATGLGLGTAGAVSASSPSQNAVDALNASCEDRGGLPVWSPYAIARCQGARANKGFESERQICEGLGDAAFVVTMSTTHMNRASWACIATVPAG